MQISTMKRNWDNGAKDVRKRTWYNRGKDLQGRELCYRDAIIDMTLSAKGKLKA